VGVLVFLFFLFFIAGHYLGVLLVFNGDTSCFIGPWLVLVLTAHCSPLTSHLSPGSWLTWVLGLTFDVALGARARGGVKNKQRK
jgi:hypothetical protein